MSDDVLDLRHCPSGKLSTTNPSVIRAMCCKRVVSSLHLNISHPHPHPVFMWLIVITLYFALLLCQLCNTKQYSFLADKVWCCKVYLRLNCYHILRVIMNPLSHVTLGTLPHIRPAHSRWGPTQLLPQLHLHPDTRSATVIYLVHHSKVRGIICNAVNTYSIPACAQGAVQYLPEG